MDKKQKTKKKSELSTPKKKSRSSNPHFICDKEAVVQLERLSDSVIAEMTGGGSALPPDQGNESNYGTLNINSLPEEIILEVFGYLEQNQLSQLAQVCRKWSVLAKSPVLWKTVNKIFSPRGGSQTTEAKSFINKLPFCVTCIRLVFTKYGDWTEAMDYVELCATLQEKCPDTKVLILTHSMLSDSLPAAIKIGSQFLPGVKNLTFHRCLFPNFSARVELCGTSNIEVLDLSFSTLAHFNKPEFSRMPHLKVLCLYCTNVFDSWFRDDLSFLSQLHVLDLGCAKISASTFPAVQNHGHNLKELYICGLNLEDYDLNFSHLKKICLSNTSVTCEAVVSLLQSCPSLQNVYVDEDVAESFAAHPFVVANRSKSGIVKAISYIHNHNVGYLHN